MEKAGMEMELIGQNITLTKHLTTLAQRFTPGGGGWGGGGGGGCRSGTSNVAAKFTLRTRHAHPENCVEGCNSTIAASFIRDKRTK